MNTKKLKLIELPNLPVYTTTCEPEPEKHVLELITPKKTLTVGKVIEKKEILSEQDDPFKFKSAQTLQKYINLYFQECDKKEIPYTISGLALMLGCTRKQLLEYESKVYYGYGDLIGQAKTKIEEYAERRLFKGQCVGAIFALKNNFKSWIDKQETKLSGPLGGILDEIQNHGNKSNSIVKRT